MELFTIKGVEIFSSGLWNGRRIEENDLDEIVSAYSKTAETVRPFLKLGHSEDQKLLANEGLPAAGWVENIRKAGTKLVADFVDIPKKIYQLIERKAYRKVSCEIYNNIEIDGNKYPKMIGAVALLGAELPGVLNLTDILSNYNLENRFSAVQKFATENETAIVILDVNEHEVNYSMDELEKAKAELDAKSKELEDAKAEAEKFKLKNAELEAKALEAQKAEQAAKVDKFVSELTAEKLCTKAMEPLVKQLCGPEVEKYSFDDKEISKQEALKSLIKLSGEAAKVNFAETTANVEKTDDELTADKVEKYALEHKVSYSEAYRALNKNSKA